MHTTTNQITTNGTNTMQVNIYSDNDTHVQHSNTQRIESVYDDTNHVIDTLPTHLPNPSQTICNVQVMFDFLCGMQDRWILTGSTKQLVEWAQDELIRRDRDWETCQ